MVLSGSRTALDFVGNWVGHCIEFLQDSFASIAHLCPPPIKSNADKMLGVTSDGLVPSKERTLLLVVQLKLEGLHISLTQKTGSN